MFTNRQDAWQIAEEVISLLLQKGFPTIEEPHQAKEQVTNLIWQRGGLTWDEINEKWIEETARIVKAGAGGPVGRKG